MYNKRCLCKYLHVLNLFIDNLLKLKFTLSVKLSFKAYYFFLRLLCGTIREEDEEVNDEITLNSK